MAVSVTPHLMFEGDAEEAMNFYTSLFDSSGIIQLEHYSAGEQGRRGKVKRAQFSLCGQVFDCIDSPVKHNFTFTPSTSLFVECDNADEQQRLFDALCEDGQVMMPLDYYGFSPRFGWVEDRFGLSWQLNLAEELI